MLGILIVALEFVIVAVNDRQKAMHSILGGPPVDWGDVGRRVAFLSSSQIGNRAHVVGSSDFSSA
jgi:hypothetical protein